VVEGEEVIHALIEVSLRLGASGTGRVSAGAGGIAICAEPRAVLNPALNTQAVDLEKCFMRSSLSGIVLHQRLKRNPQRS